VELPALTALNDPELAPYRQLHGARLLSHPVTGPCFLCEGRFLVEEALAAARLGHLRVISVLATPTLAAAMAETLPPGVRLLVAEKATLHDLAGFSFHRGLLACVALPPEPPESVMLEARRLLVLPRLDDQENLGLLLRSAAALGLDAVLLGGGPNPFDRRVVRVSMGAVWKLPVFQREEPWDLLERWRKDGSEVVGAALGPASQDARSWQVAARTALVLGPEGPGLDSDCLSRCDRLVSIPMARGVDSLNVAAAGAILMWRMSC
jgi:tRNA G18 (ribose-2'-O)-methylase SpoU